MKYKELIAQMTKEEKVSLLSGKNFWQTKAIERLKIPSIALADGPHGIRKQEGDADHLGLHQGVPATCFPTGATVANSWDPDLSKDIGKALGREARTHGVDVILGPGLNMKRSPLCGRSFEYLSEDPYLSGKIAAGYVHGIQSQGVAACPKHFVANNQEHLRMTNNSVIDTRTLHEIYLKGFEIVVKEAHPKSIMSSYNKINGVYANEHAELLQDILVDDWGFSGIVVTDWGGSNDHVAGVMSGSHLEMPATGGDSDRQLVAALEQGLIDESVIDQRVDELLGVIFSLQEAQSHGAVKPQGEAQAHTAVTSSKQRAEVFTENAEESEKVSTFDMKAHHALAERVAEESTVLLKNEDSILPLASGAQVAIIGDFAKEPRYQGAGSSLVNPTQLDNLVDALEASNVEVIGYAKGFSRTGNIDLALEKEACQLASKAEVVICNLGLEEVQETEGMDRSHARISDNQISLLQNLYGFNTQIVVILSCGSYVEMDWIEKCKALLHGYLGGQAGAGSLVRILTGAVSPSGKLSESYPYTYEDTPTYHYYPGKACTAEYREGLYVGYRYYSTVGKAVRFPFGYGLSYTTFGYDNIQVSRDSVSFDLTNTGSVAGAEVVQVYIAPESESAKRIFRPAKELKGFTKVYLNPGESTRVKVPLSNDAFCCYCQKTERFEVVDGEYTVFVAASASVEDIKLQGSITVTFEVEPPVADASSHTPDSPNATNASTNAVDIWDRDMALTKSLPNYQAGTITQVPDAEFTALLGTPIPPASRDRSQPLCMNDPLCELVYAKSFLARSVGKLLRSLKNRSIRKGKPDLNILFMYNIPFRGIAKMMNGMVSMEMAETLLYMANGHPFRGFGRLVKGWFRLRKAQKGGAV